MTSVLVMTIFYFTPKARVTKEKINKWDCIKLKGFHAAREPATKRKGTLVNGREIVANHVSAKVVSRIYKELI